VLSKHTVLPWEDEADYEKLLNSLVSQYQPQGPIEEHLVEEIAGIFWRKRRLRIAEQAAHSRALHRAVECEGYSGMSAAALVLSASDFEGRTPGILIADENWKAAALDKLQYNEAHAIAAFNVINTRDGNYERALAEFNKDQREEFERYAVTPSRHRAEILLTFINDNLFPKYRDQRLEIEHQSLTRNQAFGESVDPATLDALGRQEVRLDRKLERTLAMLIKLQSVRCEIIVSPEE